jgi:two-component system, chemotaxis family, CheB/CheR fusion protein
MEQERIAFPVVGIGASAGGLEALSELLTALAPETGMAWIVVQHLDPTHDSMLTELLASKTRLAVTEAHDGDQLRPDHLYVIPPNATMTLADRSLRLQARDTAERRHMAIDILFRSLAQVLGSNAIGVILSGTGSDGARGLEEIKSAGGITFAQDEASARFSGMPRAAIDSGCVDFVLPTVDIARELLRIKDHPYLDHNRSAAAEDGPAAPAPSPHEDNLRRIFRAVRMHYGVDFSHYKRSTMERRLARRMALRQIVDLADYARLLQSEPAEAHALGNDFLIRVTGFFRDPESFRGLAETVWPAVFDGRAHNDPLRIWVPGCASGEEAYTVAILLLEYMAEHSAVAPIQIFGTDLNDAAIEKARAGIYGDDLANEVSRDRLRRHFVKLDQRYQIAKSIRDLCIFARHDVTSDPPFSRLDLITCRNLLIYLDQPLQQRVLPLFHYALKPKAFLMLGPSESVGVTSSLFQMADSRSNIYRSKKAEATRSHATLRRNEIAAPPLRAGEMTALIDSNQAQREAERVLLARYGPACILVDDNLDILYFHGETSRFLEHARGPASLNLKNLAPPGLLLELSAAIREVHSIGGSVRKSYFPAIGARPSGENQLEVIPVRISRAEEHYYLVLFEAGAEQRDESRPTGWLSRLRTIGLPRIDPGRSVTNADSVQLRREIEALQDFLKLTIQEHEAAKEEMKSAHEELLSMNEEYLSTNEELETAKEELQSTNEELAVTNEELRNRNDELNRANRELKGSRDHSAAIIDTIREGLLVLDSDFCVMQANHSFYECFNTRPSDTIDHSLFDLGDGQWNIPLLHELLEKVLPEKRVLRDYEMTHNFPAIGERVMLLNARHLPEEHTGKEMILLAIEDITERLDAVKKADLRKSDFLSMLAHELRNPLSPIRNAAALLSAKEQNPNNLRYHQVIDRQINKLSRLIDDLLDVTRFTRGNIMLRKEPIDLLRTVNNAVEANRHSLEEKHLELSQSLPTMPLVVVADATRLEQAIGNLLENAAKYTDPQGKIALTLELERDDEAVLRIRDNGVGIAPEVLANIFDIFYQADRTLDRSRGGVGIGLSLARRLVEMHNGRLEAFSDGLGKGSEFVIRLPLAPEVHDSVGPAETGAQKLAAAASPIHTVIIVDDNADVAETMMELIVALGHKGATAHDGASALALIPTVRPDLGLIDIGLPDMVGYDLARRIRELPGGDKIFLVALTGYGREEDRKAALEAGFDRHLVKPITLQQIEELLAATNAPHDPTSIARDGGPPSVPATGRGGKPVDKSSAE